MTISDLLASNNYFTAIDKEITRTGARDPLGFEALWSYLGRQVFDNKITSIANDIRNYTLNLVHHAVIRRLYLDGTLYQLKERLAALYEYDGLTEEQAIVATIIFLENLSIYSMVRAPGEAGGLELTGLLGASKGRSEPLQEIWISPRKDAFILVNQANVGLNARYKTPFMKMRLFGPSYDYSYDSDGKPTNWPQESEIEEDIWQLRDGLVELVQKMLSNGKQPSLRIDLEKPPQRVFKIAEQYRYLFESPQMDRFPGLCDFWKHSLGLDQAPASFIYDAVKRHKPESTERQLIGTILHEAAQSADENNRTYFEAIVETERTLAPVRYAFDLLLSGGYDQADSQALQNRIQQARSEIQRGNGPAFVHYFHEAEGEAAKRAEKVSAVADAATPRELIDQLLLYHNEIMTARSNAPWIREESGNIRVLSGMMGKKPDGVYPWFHTYYVDSLSSIVSGFGNKA